MKNLIYYFILSPVVIFSDINDQAFFESIATESPKVIQCFLDKGISVNSVDVKTGYTPLMLALKEGNFDLANFFIQNNADINFISKDQNTALIFAAKYGQIKEALSLIKEGADINYKNSGGTALNYAAKYGFLPIVETLIQHSADINTISENHETPLMMAAFTGKKNIIRYLLKNNPKINIENKSEGYDALMLAIQRNHLSIIKELLKYGANTNIFRNQKITPLMVAAKYGGTDSIDILIKHGADITQEDINGNTPLIIAAEYNQLKSIRKLLKYKADINHQNNGGFSSLIIATKYEFEAMIKFLIGMNVDITLKTKKGLTAYDYAINLNNQKLIPILKIKK